MGLGLGLIAVLAYRLTLWAAQMKSGGKIEKKEVAPFAYCGAFVAKFKMKLNAKGRFIDATAK